MIHDYLVATSILANFEYSSCLTPIQYTSIVVSFERSSVKILSVVWFWKIFAMATVLTREWIMSLLHSSVIDLKDARSCNKDCCCRSTCRKENTLHSLRWLFHSFTEWKKFLYQFRYWNTRNSCRNLYSYSSCSVHIWFLSNKILNWRFAFF